MGGGDAGVGIRLRARDEAGVDDGRARVVHAGEWNDLLVEEGFGSHVVEAKLGGRGEQLERWRALDQGRAGRGRPA